MRLRYTGTCRACNAQVPAGASALYFKATRQIECLPCHDGGPKPAQPTTVSGIDVPIRPVPIDVGVAGASARREHERRVAGRKNRVRAAHPKIGGFLLAVTDEPQSIRAWAVGARGEEQLATRLNALVNKGVLVLHDRRIRGSKANIDHIAISAAGVFVIDAKRYQGRPALRVEGGILRARTETLMVGRRDCTKLLTGITKQVDLVQAALAAMPTILDPPVHGMLCFVEADWPIFGGSFTTSRIDVLWPAKASERIIATGPLTPEQAKVIHRHLAQTFPAA